jgi:hypothetical protein
MADGQDDVDKTITALLIRRMHADPEAFSGLVTEIGLAVSSRPDVLAADPPPTGARKRSKLKTGPSPEENSQLSKLRKPLATRDIVEQDTVLATATALKETARAGPHPTASHHATTVRPSGSESRSVRRNKSAHTLEGRLAVKGGTPVTTHATQTEVNVNSGSLASVETTSTLRTLTGNSQLLPSTGNTPQVPSFPGGSASGVGLRTGVKPTIPEGVEISGVPVEAHGEGSSEDSSSEDEDEEGTAPLAKPATSIGDPSVPMNLLEGQLTALIRGPEKRGPRRSVLDEIPSSSETGSESSPEDLMLDEEEDLSRQPSRKQKAFSKNRLSSIEPETEPPSEDEGSASLHVFMDAPNEAQHYLPVSSFIFLEASRGEIDNISKHSAAGDVEVASADAVAEQGAPEFPGFGTPAERPLEGRRQDSSGSVHTPSGNGHASDTQPGTETLRTTSPESDATAINTEPAKARTLASPERLSGRVLVPAPSPFVTKALVNAGEKVQTQDEIDDVEPAEESIDGYKESDPIEPEPNEPSVDLASTHPNIDSILRQLRKPASRTTLNSSPDPEQSSRRSGRLANRQPFVITLEATPALARQPNRKASVSLKKSAAKEDHERTQNGVEEISQEKPARKQVGKGRKVARQTTAQEDGSAREPNPSLSEWTALPPPSQTQTSATDQPRTSSPGPMSPLLPLGDDVSLSADIGEDTPMPIRRGVTVASQGKGVGGQPLFFPGSSQAPRTQTAPSPSASESEAEKVASRLRRKTPTRSTPSGGSFRSLSGLASQDILFPKVRAAKVAFNNTPSLKVKQPVLEAEDDEDDEESSSSSDDVGEVPISHIPKERRAGATPSRKGSRLSLLASRLGRGRN